MKNAEITLSDKYLHEPLNPPDIELYREVLIYKVGEKTAYMMAVIELNKVTDTPAPRSYNMDADVYFNPDDQDDHSDEIPPDILGYLETLAKKQVWSDYEESKENRKIMGQKLKPCKWCGGKGMWIVLDQDNLVGIECSDCHIGTGFRKSVKEAFECW